MTEQVLVLSGLKNVVDVDIFVESEDSTLIVVSPEKFPVLVSRIKPKFDTVFREEKICEFTNRRYVNYYAILSEKIILKTTLEVR